jgi:hypothetical protein
MMTTIAPSKGPTLPEKEFWAMTHEALKDLAITSLLFYFITICDDRGGQLIRKPIPL